AARQVSHRIARELPSTDSEIEHGRERRHADTNAGAREPFRTELVDQVAHMSGRDLARLRALLEDWKDVLAQCDLALGERVRCELPVRPFLACNERIDKRTDGDVAISDNDATAAEQISDDARSFALRVGSIAGLERPDELLPVLAENHEVAIPALIQVRCDLRPLR